MAEVNESLPGGVGQWSALIGQRSMLTRLRIAQAGRIWAELARVGPARPGHVSASRSTTWRARATTGLGSQMRLMVDCVARVPRPQTGSTVDHTHSFSSFYGSWWTRRTERGGKGAMAPSSSLAISSSVASSQCCAPRWLGEATKGLVDIAGLR